MMEVDRRVTSRGNLGGDAFTSGSAGNISLTTTALAVPTLRQRALVDARLAAQADPDAVVSPEIHLPTDWLRRPLQPDVHHATVGDLEYNDVLDKQRFAARCS